MPETINRPPIATAPENDAAILVRLPRALRDRVNRCAAADGVLQNAFCIEALLTWCTATELFRASQEEPPKPAPQKGDAP